MPPSNDLVYELVKSKNKKPGESGNTGVCQGRANKPRFGASALGIIRPVFGDSNATPRASLEKTR